MAIKHKYDIGILAEVVHASSGARAAVDLAVTFAQRGHKVTFYATDLLFYQKTAAYLQANNINVRLTHVSRTPILGRLIASYRLWRYLRTSTHQILQSQVFPSMFWAAKLSGIPIITTFYGTQFDVMRERFLPPSFTYFLVRPLDMLLNLVIILKSVPSLILSQKIVSISSYCQLQAKRIYGVSSEVIYLGTNFAPLKKHPGGLRFISVSRITPYKGFHQLIKTFNQFCTSYQGARLTIAGSNPNPKYLDYLNLIKNRHTQILINISAQKLQHLYSTANVYLSWDRNLFFGLPIIEAARLGIPTIAFDTCAAPELIRSSINGYLFHSQSELLKYMHKLQANPDLIQKMGVAATRLSRRFNWLQASVKYEKIFAEIETGRKKTDFFPLISMSIFAILLRLFFLNQHDIWFDEAISYFEAIKPTAQILRLAASDNTPPLFLLIQHFWLKIVPHTEFFIRLPAFIYMSLAHLFMYGVFRLYTNHKNASTAVILSFALPFFLYAAGESRNLSLFLFLSLLTQISAFTAIKNPRAFAWVVFLAVSICLWYTHYYAVFVFIMLSIYVISRKPPVQSLIKFAAVLSVSATVFVPWIIYTFSFTPPAPYSYPPPKNLMALLMQFSLGDLRLNFFPQKLSILTLLFGAQICFILYLFLKAFLFNNKSAVLKVILVTPIMILFLLSLTFPVFSVRSLIFIYPFGLLLLVVTLAQEKQATLQLMILGGLMVSISISQLIFPQFRGLPLKQKANEISELPQTDLVHQSTLTYYPFRYYLKSSKKNYLSGFNPLSKYLQTSLEDLTVKTEPNREYIYIDQNAYYSLKKD